MTNKTAENNGHIVEFFSDEHKYILDGATRLKSATTLVKKYFPEFDTQRIATAYAKKHKMEIEDVIAKWDKIRDEACEFGTLIHAWAELLLENGDAQIKPTNEKETAYLDAISKYIPQLKEEYEIIAIEKLLFDPDSKIAGTPDIIARKKDDGLIYILDWKTSKTINYENKWESGFGPLENIPNANYYHYCLQLNIYGALLIKNYGYTGPIKGKILHIMPDRVEEIDTLDSFMGLAQMLLDEEK